MELHLTTHARTRMQQRGIRADKLEALFERGRVVPAPGGAEMVVLKKTYAILGRDGAVVTVGHRNRRLPRT